ncbi:retrovirus-related pol polyprotein from transposon TNT 1-94 [Tanacetum coccineum]
MRNKPDIDEVDIDDLYNNLRVYEDELKRSSGSNSASQNLAFLSSEYTNSTNEVSTASGDFLERSNAQTTESSSQALVAQDGLGGYDWSNDFEVEPVNYALMAISSSNSSSSSDRNPLTLRADISFARLDENNGVSKLKINRDEVIIEDWTSDDEDDVCADKTVSSVKPNVTQAVKSGQTSQKQGIGFKKVHKIKACYIVKGNGPLIKDCDSFDQKSLGTRVKNVSILGKRVLNQYGLWHRSISTVRPVYTVRPVSTARPLASKIAQSNSVIRPNHPRLDIDHAVVDSGCSSHMTGNKAYLSDYEDFNGGFVAFGSDPKGALSFLMKVKLYLELIRKDDVYSLDLKNIVPSGGLEKQLNHNVKIIRCDNGTEFKNYVMNEFCAKKGIKREFSVARTLQQNGILTACYILRHKFDGKSDEGYLLGYSTSSKAFRVYNKRTKRVEENLHINFLEDQPNVARTGPNWMFDLDFLTTSMNYIPVSVERNQVNYRCWTRIPVKDVVQDAQEQPSENASPDKGIQDSEDVFDKEWKILKKPEDEQLDFKKKRGNCIQKKAAQATSTNQLSTDRPFVSTDRSFVSTDRSNTPNVSAASTSTGDIVPVLPAMLAGAAVDQGEAQHILLKPHHSLLIHFIHIPTPIPSPPHPLPPPHSSNSFTTPITTSFTPHSPPQSQPHFSLPRSYEAPLPKGNTSGSAEDSMQLKELMVLVPTLVTKINSLEKEVKNLRSQGRGKIQDIDDDPLVSLVRESMKEKSTDFVTPTKASGEAQEEEISPTILEAAKTLSKIDTGLDAEEEINTGREEINTGIEKVSMVILYVDSGYCLVERGQREGKAPMIEEDIQATHKTKEQMRQEEAGLEEAIKLQA